ncbi:MAG: aspartate/glutamate racemase family protein, partial [Vibrio sp.]
MKIQLINPNTSQAMTDKMAQAARAIALPTSEIIATQPEHGPMSIESAFDDAIATAALLDRIAEGSHAQVDAHVIACFGDPGLDAAREIANAPVIGIAEAAFHTASLLCRRFSVVTTLSSTVPTAHHLLERYGFRQLCANVRASEIAVLDLEHSADAVYQQLLDECWQAIRIDRAEAIVLGCAGMADMVKRLSETLPIPIIDGVTAAITLAENLVRLKL